MSSQQKPVFNYDTTHIIYYMYLTESAQHCLLFKFKDHFTNPLLFCTRKPKQVSCNFKELIIICTILKTIYDEHTHIWAL